MGARLSFVLAYQHLRRSFGRVTLSIAAIALGVALVVAVRLMNVAVLAWFLDTIDGMVGRAALTVTAGESLSFDERLVERIAAVPGVTLAVPLVRGTAFPDDGSGELLTVHGVDVTHDAAVRVYHRGDGQAIVDDTVAFLNARDSIVVGRAYAERRGLSIGSPIRLVTPTGVRPFVIRGLLDPEGLARTLDGRLIVMDLFAAEAAFTTVGQINQIDLLVDAGAEERVQASVRAILPAGLTVDEPATRKDIRRRVVAGFQNMLTAFALLAAIAGFVICYTRLGTIFAARAWEIGLLRAVGLTRTDVFLEMLKESVLLGLSGTALGVPLGVVIARLGLPTMAATTAINFHLPVAALTPGLTWDTIALGASVGIGAALIAALVPALRLSRIEPVAALRMRDRQHPVAGGVGRVVAVGILATGAAALIVGQQRSGSADLGLVTTAIVALATYVAAHPLVHLGGWILGRAWERLFGATGELVASHLRERGPRESLTVATLGLGLAVVLMFGLLAGSFEETLVARIAARTQADLTITSAYQGGGYLGAPIHMDLLGQVRALSGVTAVVGQQRRDIPFGAREITLDGYDPECFRDRRVCVWSLGSDALPDALTLVARGDAALITRPFARQHRLHPGSVIDLPSPSGPRRYRIAALTDSEIANVIVISRDEYRRHWNDATISWAYVSVDTDPAGVREAITRTLGQTYRLNVQTRAQFVDSLAAQAHQAFSVLYLMDGIVFLLVLIGIGDTLATGVLERTREFGMLRAVGVWRSTLFSLVLLEGSTIGVFGLALAAVGGLALGTYWVLVQFPALVGWSLDLHFPWGFAVGTGLLALVLCLMGSLPPALRAARLRVATALRHE